MAFYRVFADQEFWYRKEVFVPSDKAPDEAAALVYAHDTTEPPLCPEPSEWSAIDGMQVREGFGGGPAERVDGGFAVPVIAKGWICGSFASAAKDPESALGVDFPSADFPDEIDGGWKFDGASPSEPSSDCEEVDAEYYERCAAIGAIVGEPPMSLDHGSAPSGP